MSKIGYIVIIERFERIWDCGKEVGDEVEVICGDGSSYKVEVKEIK